MNRRQFFKRTAGVLAAAAVAPYALRQEPVWFVNSRMVTLTYQGKSFVYDRHCPPNRVYFLNQDNIYVFKGSGVYKLVPDA